jgi:hypothetical protein
MVKTINLAFATLLSTATFPIQAVEFFSINSSTATTGTMSLSVNSLGKR